MIAELVGRAARLLPDQGPLQTFVHHNTLHAFEHLPFEDAVIAAADVFGTRPYQTEAAFNAHVRSGRITRADIEAVVAAEVADDDAPVVPGGPTRSVFTALRLERLIDVPDERAMPWLLAETDALHRVAEQVDPARRAELLRLGAERDVLAGLWNRLLGAATARVAAPPPTTRPRDRIVAGGGQDPDLLVHPLLIRLTAAYLDQGVAYWPMPDREHGFLAAFRGLYGQPGGPPEPFLRGLATTLREQVGWSAEDTITWALRELAVPEPQSEEVIEATLLSLRGWAGIMRQYELRPDRAPVTAPPARLLDYLAVHLLLDVFAARHTAPSAGQPVAPTPSVRLGLVYEAFALAQILPVHIGALDEHAGAWLAAVERCDERERRRLLHAAYERRHRVSVLGGIAAHQQVVPDALAPADFQAVFCIDEREESLRRHLEENTPGTRTYGAAGFFGVAMTYQGVHDVRPRPLCPVIVEPKHFVREVVIDGDRRTGVKGTLRRHATVGGRTLLRGGALTLGMAAVSVASLIGRCLLPRQTHHWAARWDHTPEPVTRLQLEATGESTDGLAHGYTTAEMAAIVSGLLRATGISRGFAPLVLIVGHGSSSLNNPHESAHDCGATGGGRGGPNARAFAAMANHPAVRAALRESGVDIPDDTWFVGAYHNTADDTMTYADEDLVPQDRTSALHRAKDALAAACALDAHERCRRFESAPPDLAVDRALAHVGTHSVDLGQPRPEYGHATNAVCVVGRRDRTRGLYLDRRAFLVSYEPESDPGDALLTGLLLAAGPVCAGINLEYYFSYVDPTGYGCGTKLPHNIVGLFGVMDGHSSDLRTGLPWQMVEIHEPVRLLLIVEAEPERLSAIIDAHPVLTRLVGNRWIQLVSWDPKSPTMHVHQDGTFQPYEPETTSFPVVDRSVEVYRGKRDHLGPAHVRAAMTPAELLPEGVR